MKKLNLIILLFAFATLARTQTEKPSVNIVFDGDSQTAWDVYPAKIIELLQLNSFNKVQSINYAVSGQNTSQMVSDVSSQIVPRYNSNYDENIVLYYIGYNDTHGGESTNTSSINNKLINYYNTLKSAGFKVLMINLPDGINRTGIDLINAMFLREHANLSDTYVNCRESEGVFENYTNTNYYRDNVHLNVLGCNYLAEHYVYPKLTALIGTSNPPQPPPPSPPSSANLNNGLFAYFNFDETSGTAIDKVGSNNGIVSSGVSRGATGKIQSAYFFDNNDDFITLSSKITKKTGSYSFWIRIDAIPDDLLIMGSDAHKSRIFIGRNNNLKIETNTNNEEFAFYTSFAIATWYNVVLTREENIVKLYRNGTYIGSSTISGSDNLTLSQIGFNSRSFRGAIDELGIWSRALTKEEVSLIYNNGKGISHPFETETMVAVTSVSISPANQSIAIGTITTLTSVIAPDNASNKTVSWNSENPAIASVTSAGNVTGLTIGSTTITATTQDGLKVASCEIIVTDDTQTPLWSGLKLYYAFDETSGAAFDEVGANDAVVSPGVTRGSAGILNGSYLFDSNKDFVSLPFSITQKPDLTHFG